MGGVEFARYNNNRKGWNNQGGLLPREIENSRFLSLTRIFYSYIYVNSDVTNTFTCEL